MDISTEAVIEEWRQDEPANFVGIRSAMKVQLGLTPQLPFAPDQCDFSVYISFRWFNADDRVVFVGKTHTRFSLKNDGVPPTVELLFGFYASAEDSFVQLYQERTKGTFLGDLYFDFGRRQLDDMRGKIQECIDNRALPMGLSLN